MHHEPIKISIVTVCRNAHDVIEKTIKSVLEQDYNPIEYIIIDGASVDGTLDVVRRYEDRLSRIISEPDQGIYDAMNKGVQCASGDYILILNAGDFLIHPSVIGNVARAISDQKFKDIDVISARLLVYTPNGQARIWNPKKSTRLSRYHGSLPHPSTFQSKKAFRKNGLFDTTYRVAGDFEWFARGYVVNNLTFRNLNLLTTVFINDGVSVSVDWKKIQNLEIERLRAKHFSRRWRFWLDIGRFLKKNKLL